MTSFNDSYDVRMGRDRKSKFKQGLKRRGTKIKKRGFDYSNSNSNNGNDKHVTINNDKEYLKCGSIMNILTNMEL